MVPALRIALRRPVRHFLLRLWIRRKSPRAPHPFPFGHPIAGSCPARPFARADPARVARESASTASIAPGSRNWPSETLEIKSAEFIELLFFLFAQLVAQYFAGLILVHAPDFTEVFSDAALLLRGKFAKGTTQEDQRAFEFLLCQRTHIAIELFPESESRQQGIAVALGQPFEPSRTQIGGNARGKPAGNFLCQFFIRDQATLDQKRAGVAGQQ